MADERFVAIGSVVRTHGLKGEISIAPAFAISLESLVGLSVWLTPPSGVVRATRITAIRQGPKGPLVTLDGVKSIETASQIVGKQLVVEASELPEDVDPEDELELDGYRVHDERRGLIGEISETLITGANDVWVVHGAYGEVLIPVIEDVVVEIDDDKQLILVKLLDGLMPDEGE